MSEMFFWDLSFHISSCDVFIGKITSKREAMPDNIYTVCLDNWKLANDQRVNLHVTASAMTKKV